MAARTARTYLNEGLAVLTEMKIPPRLLTPFHTVYVNATRTALPRWSKPKAWAFSLRRKGGRGIEIFCPVLVGEMDYFGGFVCQGTLYLSSCTLAWRGNWGVLSGGTVHSLAWRGVSGVGALEGVNLFNSVQTISQFWQIWSCYLRKKSECVSLCIYVYIHTDNIYTQYTVYIHTYIGICAWKCVDYNTFMHWVVPYLNESPRTWALGNTTFLEAFRKTGRAPRRGDLHRFWLCPRFGKKSKVTLYQSTSAFKMNGLGNLGNSFLCFFVVAGCRCWISLAAFWRVKVASFLARRNVWNLILIHLISFT